MKINKILLYSLTCILLSFVINSCMQVRVNGKVTNSKGEPILANIIIQDLASNDTLNVFTNDEYSGSYSINFNEQKHYSYSFHKEGYFPIARNIDLRENIDKFETEDNVVLTMYSIDEVIESKKFYTIDNLFFAHNEAEVLESSKPSLYRIADIIIDNNIKTIELVGYTDSTGQDDYNMKLSLKRAENVAAYMKEYKCKNVSFRVRGLGKDNPIADNSTEAGRAKNRRVEIKFIK